MRRALAGVRGIVLAHPLCLCRLECESKILGAPKRENESGGRIFRVEDRHLNAGRNPPSHHTKIQRANIGSEDLGEIGLRKDSRLAEDIHLNACRSRGDHVFADLDDRGCREKENGKKDSEGERGHDAGDFTKRHEDRPEQHTEDNGNECDEGTRVQALLK